MGPAAWSAGVPRPIEQPDWGRPDLRPLNRHREADDGVDLGSAGNHDPQCPPRKTTSRLTAPYIPKMAQAIQGRSGRGISSFQLHSLPSVRARPGRADFPAPDPE